MANNYNYGFNPYFYDLSQPFYCNDQQQSQQYSAQQSHTVHTVQQVEKQPQQQETTSDNSTTQGDQPPRGGTAKKQQRERWNPDDERALVQLWAEHNLRLESKDSRKVWDEIVKTLNETRKTKKTVDQCQRKIKHLKTLYKDRKDWNRRQSGGHIRKSPHYDEFDKVLGCKDIITCKNVEQMGTSTSTSSATATSSSADSDKETSSVESSPSGQSATTSSAAKKAVTKRKQRKGKGRKREVDSDSDDDDLKTMVKKMAQEDGQMTKLVDNLQQSQTQQMQLMNQLLTSFNRYMDKKFEK